MMIKVIIQHCMRWSQSLFLQDDSSESFGMVTLLYAYYMTFLYDLRQWISLDTMYMEVSVLPSPAAIQSLKKTQTGLY